MKKRLAALAVVALVAVMFAGDAVYDAKRPPRVSLPSAYGQAVGALGGLTNRYHCVGAGLTTTFSSDGGWLFSFCSTNGKPKSVIVPFGQAPIVEDDIRR
jgi:hypothetical protein